MSPVASGIFLVEHWVGIVPNISLVMGKESLFIYILHLVIVYGSAVNRGLAQSIGPSIRIPQALGVFAAVVAAIAGIILL